MNKYVANVITDAIVGDFVSNYAPTVSNVSSAMRRWIYRSTVPSMIRLGWSANRSIELMRQHGIGFRRSNMLKIYNSFKKTGPKPRSTKIHSPGQTYPT